MFGLNWGELVVIGIVALIAIGPKELPTVLRTIGHWMGKVRRMANEFQGQFQEALREAELTDLQKHADDLGNSVKSFTNIDPLADEQKEIERIGEGAGRLPDEAVTSEAATSAPVTGETGNSETRLALPTSEEVPLPEISVPLPETPPPVSEKDFAAAEPEPIVQPAAVKKAGGGA
jgi:sec-independent protein translocase protein TatB